MKNVNLHKATKTSGLLVANNSAVYMPSRGAPAEVAAIITKVGHRADAFDLLNAAVRAYPDNRLADHRRESEWRYELDATALGMRVVRVFLFDEKEFCGTLPEFLRWSQTTAPALVERLVGKTVRFWYQGGTRPGHRTLLVEKVDAAHIAGTDINHLVEEREAGRSHPGYRQYAIDNIVGEVIVL